MTSLETALALTDTQLQEKTAEVLNQQTKLASAQAQHERQLQDKMNTVSHLQDDLNRLRAQKEHENEGWRRRERDLEQSLGQSEQVRQSLLAQVERNGEELEKLTERLAMVQGRDAEMERCRAEAEQLKQIVSCWNTVVCAVRWEGACQSLCQRVLLSSVVVVVCIYR